MRVNNIDNRTNFKMSLKINPKLQPEIAKKGNRFLSFLDIYGNGISDVKLYHVVLDQNVYTPKIIHHDPKITRDFFAELKKEEDNLGKWYEIPTGFDGDSRGGFFPDEPRVFQKLYGKKAKEKYIEFKKLNVYEQAAEYSRMLEELDIKKMIAEEKEKSEALIKDIQEKEEQNKLIRVTKDLIEKYKYEEPVAAVDTAPKKSSKKSWWQMFCG